MAYKYWHTDYKEDGWPVFKEYWIRVRTCNSLKDSINYTFEHLDRAMAVIFNEYNLDWEEAAKARGPFLEAYLEWQEAIKEIDEREKRYKERKEEKDGDVH